MLLGYRGGVVGYVSIQRFSCEGAFWGPPRAFAVPSPSQSAGAARALKMVQKGSKMIKKAQRGSKRRSKRLFEPARCRQCARRGCSSLLRCLLCAQSGFSSVLFEIAVRKSWSRLHCALSHCTLHCFAPCMDMHGSTLVYICLLYTSPSPRDRTRSRMPSSA